jgi:hypothetical protein
MASQREGIREAGKHPALRSIIEKSHLLGAKMHKTCKKAGKSSLRIA